MHVLGVHVLATAALFTAACAGASERPGSSEPQEARHVESARDAREQERAPAASVETPTRPEPEPEGASEGGPPALPPPGVASCDRRPAYPTCLELVDQGCPAGRRPNTESLRRMCDEGGDRFAEGPCRREGATRYSGSGPPCGTILIWFYESTGARRAQ